MVKLVKKELGVMTLAVGDGANDVSMIQTASVGIGIAGREGNQVGVVSDHGPLGRVSDHGPPGGCG